jgi:hypothetical protein
LKAISKNTKKRKRPKSPILPNKRANTKPEGPNLPVVVDTTGTGGPVVLVPPTPLSTQDTPAPNPMEITKRDLLTVPLTDRDRVRLDAESNPNRPALKAIYEEFYANGVRKNNDAALAKHLKDKLYFMMGYSNADYIKENVSSEDFDKFLKLPNADVNSQTLMFGKIAAHKAWRTAMAQWNQQPTGEPPVEPSLTQTPEEKQDVLEQGDYFYVQNRGAGGAVRKQPQRRIVVNVGSQQAALKVSEALGGLFGDPAVSPHLKEFKVYLNNADTKPTTVKRDKLVVYYSPDPDASTDDDTIGNRIAETIEDAVNPEDVGGEFAPFYARIGKSTAWAEETEAFVQALKGSFTQTREALINKVITRNPKPTDLDTFIREVGKAFQANWIDPEAPHTHLETATQ